MKLDDFNLKNTILPDCTSVLCCCCKAIYDSPVSDALCQENWYLKYSKVQSSSKNLFKREISGFKKYWRIKKFNDCNWSSLNNLSPRALSPLIVVLHFQACWTHTHTPVDYSCDTVCSNFKNVCLRLQLNICQRYAKFDTTSKAADIQSSPFWWLTRYYLVNVINDQSLITKLSSV